MMGRPTKYNADMLAKAQDYIETHADHDDLVPSIEGLAFYLGVGRKNLYNWAEENEEFLHTLEKIKEKQAKMLISGGLGGDYNSTIAKLMLFNHGYTDKQQIEHGGDIHIQIGDEWDNV